MHIMSVKEAISRISAYSADTFGVCSALFELGGMIVIHDPSGCNSTYTTHDEPRWYDTDSLLFISGLTEMDAVMGNDDKLIHDVVDGAKEFNPKFIVLLGTPVPFMMGTDLDAIAAAIEGQTGILTMAAPTNSMHTYEQGIEWALNMLAQRVVRDRQPAAPCGSASSLVCSWQPEFASCGGVGKSAPSDAIGVNVLGLTPLDFAMNGSDQSIREFLEGCGFSVISTWAMGSRLGNIRRAGEADVNLVVSGSALAAAQTLQQRFGTPYVVGVPMGRSLQGGTAMDIRMAAAAKSSRYTCAKRMGPDKDDVIIIGESVYAASLAAALSHEYGHGVRVYCPLQAWPGVLQDKDRTVVSEAELQQCLADFRGTVIADPLYRPVCPDSAAFIPLGHEAFSGRLYEKDIPNLIDDFDSFARQITREA